MKNNANGDMMFISLHMDDLIFTRNNQKMVDNFKYVMIIDFEMADMAFMPCYLGIEVKQCEYGIFVCNKTFWRYLRCLTRKRSLLPM